MRLWTSDLRCWNRLRFLELWDEICYSGIPLPATKIGISLGRLNKMPQARWTAHHKCISHSSRGWKIKIKFPSDLVSGERSRPGL